MIIYHRHAGGAIQSYNENIIYMLGGVIAVAGVQRKFLTLLGVS
jgi:hypothetical protein